jgi:transcriptional regulator with XRE-family HTH domain
MHYTQLFRTLREDKGVTIEGLARMARCHRNTVANVESGRPIKFKTLSKLMLKLGYAANSIEMKSIALLWLEAVSGLPFSRPETGRAARRTIGTYRSAARETARQLNQAVTRAGLSPEIIRLLIFAANHPGALATIANVRDLAFELSARKEEVSAKAAES